MGTPKIVFGQIILVNILVWAAVFDFDHVKIRILADLVARAFCMRLAERPWIYLAFWVPQRQRACADDAT